MRWALAFAPVLAMLPATALAAEESRGSSTLWHLANFALFLAAVVYFGRTPIRSFLAERRRDIEENLGSARRELSAAEARLEECRSRLANLDRELEELRTTVREQAEAQRRRILDDARAAAERVRRDASAAVEQEVRRALGSLRLEAGELAVRLAADLLKQRVGDEDRERLVDEFVQRIENPGPGDATELRS